VERKAIIIQFHEDSSDLTINKISEAISPVPVPKYSIKC
jgi:hypothetical protein